MYIEESEDETFSTKPAESEKLHESIEELSGSGELEDQNTGYVKGLETYLMESYYTVPILLKTDRKRKMQEGLNDYVYNFRIFIHLLETNKTKVGDKLEEELKIKAGLLTDVS